jgi:glycosyltransferase involved in cell wall biosynthesis
MNIQYSVIIPHKNCLDLLLRCVNSIPDRDDIEVIVVDDYSNNQDTVKNEIEALNRQNVIVVLAQKSGGGGYARNQGLKITRGKWLLFSDSDDYFIESAFDTFDKYSEEKDDIIFFKHIGIISNTGEIVPRSEYRNVIIDNYLKEKTSRSEAFMRYNNAVPWAKMIRHSLVEEYAIDFEEVPASNDTMFSTKIGHFARSIAATVRRGSITHTKSRERYYSDFAVYVRRNSFLLGCSHSECQTRIFGQVVYAFMKYGISEGIKYIRYARQYNVSFLYGAGQTISESMGKGIRKLFKTDKYTIKK